MHIHWLVSVLDFEYLRTDPFPLVTRKNAHPKGNELGQSMDYSAIFNVFDYDESYECLQLIIEL